MRFSTYTYSAELTKFLSKLNSVGIADLVSLRRRDRESVTLYLHHEEDSER